MHDRLLIAGTNSGCGKTTATCALLCALKARGKKAAAFKCGPDYIDPMFHREAIGIPSHNLDPFFCPPETLREQFAAGAGEISVIEGVMGYYDGAGTDGRFSTYDVARATKTPVVLVMDAHGMYTSAGAILQGFRGFREESGVRGVIFNGASPMLYKGLARIARDAGVEPYGFLPRVPELSVPSRHLGLYTAGEIADINEKLRRLGELAGEDFDMEGLLSLAGSAPELPTKPKAEPSPERVRVAVARDEAFCFIYQENLETLRALGCELCFFSPVHDAALPERIGGLYLPGGYPELYARELAENRTMRAAVKAAVSDGVPTIAECGGFMYLHDSLDGEPMAGAIGGASYKTDRLQRFGYVTMTAGRDNLLCRDGESTRAHEFHFYESENCGGDFAAVNAGGGKEYRCCHAGKTLYAGFPHLFFPANPAFAEGFVNGALEYAAR